MTPLKEATAPKHRKAEQMDFNQRMFRGELSKAEYLMYLEQQLAIFEELERNPLPHPALNRQNAVNADIAEIKAEGFSGMGLLNSTQNYISYLHELDDESRLAHVYLNYLAIMFGGQMMKKVVPSSGKMYEFSDTPAAMQSIRQVQKDSWADEVNRGFDFANEQFRELEEQSKSITTS